MFEFMKRKERKTEQPSLRLSADEYMRSVQDKLYPYWVDEVLLQKVGYKNPSDIFIDGVTSRAELSYEDACDCITRISRMVDEIAYVGAEFGKRSNELNEQSSQALKQHMDDCVAGKKSGSTSFVFDHDFYSAWTLKELFIEAKTNARFNSIEMPQTREAAMKKLNDMLGGLVYIKKVSFETIMIFAHSALAEMKGF